MFTQKNIQQIKDHGLSEAEINRQLTIFKNGIPFANVVEAAAIGHGIEALSEAQQHELVAAFEAKKNQLDLLKFVPASGAATRMFQFLHCFLDEANPKMEQDETKLQKEENSNLKTFFNAIEDFPFSSLVKKQLKEKYPEYETLENGEKLHLFISEMLSEGGLNFSNTPKGLIPFHKYAENYTTAFGEQLYEATFYATSNGVAKLHFTISAEHEQKFRDNFGQIRDAIEKKTGVTFDISFSFQKKETDTLAATPQNEPFFDENAQLVFRPSGHGALLNNLNEVDADIIFIKNIDNVVSEKYVEKIAFQKKVLAGKLLSLQQKIFSFIEKLQSENPSESVVADASKFISEVLKIDAFSNNKEAILKILNRPTRVCGVVENTGAPGGGPFLIKDKQGNYSYQIVEISQIDIQNQKQKFLVERATHFNPVDLVCGVRNYKGEKYDLLKYSDPDAGFISEKSYHGKPIKALELPGLWNGAMANWNTVFVEVPLITFNPVKTVNDLLNEVHQPQ